MFTNVYFLEGCDVYSNDTQSSTQIAQIYTDKSWFYICYDGFTPYDADVICRETALASAISFESVTLDSLSQQRPISPYNYACNGNESSICSCESERLTCDSNTVVSVKCDNPGKYF